ncbi:hypothetical protein BGZ52_001447 [Haplosporangium bisporale]|nr:hypothetical protein BGZ52_001447 [Haplosporangium bisporale]KAF9210478.1 hypothetical protein BGZ59_009384 [Podila verticillata]KFH70231.1 hypothetical protein MVEG_03082 [Podila verticillata NRRL 6337]
MTRSYFQKSCLLVTITALAAIATTVAGAYDCSEIRVEGNTYNIDALKSITYTVTGKSKVVKPSTIREDYHLNPCQPIDIPEGKESENCEKGTWVCKDTKLITEQDKESKETQLFLQQIAGSAPADESTKTPARDVDPLAVKADKLEDVKDLPWTLTLHGGAIDSRNQSAVITFICDKSATDVKVAPTFTSYVDGVASFTWKTEHACPIHTELPTAPGMSGFSVFMTVLFVFAVIYVVLGAVYNHQVYGAKGLDLLPNLDFWRDFPGLVVDVVRHVWDSVTGRATSSRGYVSV